MKTIVLLILTVFVTNALWSLVAQAAPAIREAPYCLALRGNGESQPAHWGALARTVELNGLQKLMSGGSSATISMFWLEAMAANPHVLNQKSQLQKERVSLMLKSLLGFVGIVKKSTEFQDFMELFGKIDLAKKTDVTKSLQSLVQKKNLTAAQGTLIRAYNLGLLDPEYASLILRALENQDLKKSQFYISELQETLRVFGAFNAATDQNIFFRSGIVSFERLAKSFGKIAHFYSAQGADNDLEAEWLAFFKMCAPISVGKTWTELMQDEPMCGQKFTSLFQSHFAPNQPEIPMEELQVGYAIPALPTTSVLIKEAAIQARSAMTEYHAKMDPAFGKSFKINQTDDVRFGYWGTAANLAKIAANLQGTQDEKSRRFYPFGQASWKEVLSLSPAEPGLSRLKTFKNQGQTLVSAGGWSDLHPVLVLKAAGCENVIYLTRQGGESLFAQGVAKRLLNLDRSWEHLETSTTEIKARNADPNNRGDSFDQTSTWSRLYNLGNPQSSLNESLRQASAIFCTNWNAYDIKTELVQLIENSYRSSFQVQSSDLQNLLPFLTENKPGCQAL
jgi:hypothetical protein